MVQNQFDLGGIILHLLYIFLPLILGGIHLLIKPFPNQRKRIAELFLTYYLVIGVGFQGILGGLFQILFSPFIAGYVGWPYSPFVLEVGMANLAFGILGILSIWIKNGWRAATAVGYSLFLLFAAIGHIGNLIREGNLSIGNVGPTLWSDILVPVALLILLWLTRKR